MKTLIAISACLVLTVPVLAQKRKTTRSTHSSTVAVATVNQRFIPSPYHPETQPLYKTIVRMDSLYFDTYNHNKAALMDSLTADNIEFYHDRGGLTTSKQELLQSIQKNIFGKVQRILTPGSIEVYEIPGYGAIEFGYHSFRNLVENIESEPAKFMIIWRNQDNRWQITRVVSLH